MAQILCFGDSITQGYTDTEGGWTQRLRKYLDQQYIDRYEDGITNPAHGVFNLGISGDTSEGLLKRMENEVKPRLLSEKQVVIIAIGTNDSVFKLNTNEYETTNEQFGVNIRRITAIARKHTNHIVLVGLLPCEESKMQPMPWSNTGKSYSNERLKGYNEELKKAASEESIDFINLFDDQINQDYALLLHDGIHPNAKGHQLIADKVSACIKGWL